MTCQRHPTEPRTEPNRYGQTFCRGCLRDALAAKPEAFLLDGQVGANGAFRAWLDERKAVRPTGPSGNVLVRQRVVG